MTNVKNANGKLVCQVDESTQTIEIIHKGFKTLIRFIEKGKIQIINTKTVA